MAAPSHFYRQHGEIEAPLIDARHFRPGWRVRSRLDRLFVVDKAISARAYRAGVEFRDLAERAEAGAHPRSFGIGIGRSLGYTDSTDGVQRRIEAQARLQEIALRLGAIPFALLDLAIVKNLAWAAIGRGLDVDPKTARAWAIAAINALAQI